MNVGFGVVCSYLLEKTSSLTSSVICLYSRFGFRYTNVDFTIHLVNESTCHDFGTSQYLRSHCALYRTAVIKELGVNFSLKNEVAGKAMHEKMIEAGYEMEFLPATTLLGYMEHLNHATIVLNPELGGRAQTIKKGTRRINQRLAVTNAVLADGSLDN